LSVGRLVNLPGQQPWRRRAYLIGLGQLTRGQHGGQGNVILATITGQIGGNRHVAELVRRVTARGGRNPGFGHGGFGGADHDDRRGRCSLSRRRQRGCESGGRAESGDRQEERSGDLHGVFECSGSCGWMGCSTQSTCSVSSLVPQHDVDGRWWPASPTKILNFNEHRCRIVISKHEFVQSFLCWRTIFGRRSRPFSSVCDRCHNGIFPATLAALSLTRRSRSWLLASRGRVSVGCITYREKIIENEHASTKGKSIGDGNRGRLTHWPE